MGFFKGLVKGIAPIAGGLLGSVVPGVGTALGATIGAGLGKVGEGLLGTGGDYLSHQLIGKPAAEEAYAQSKAATALQYERQKEMYKHRYQWMMEDMRKAGLNPILAAGSAGFSTTGTPQISPAQSFQARSPYGAFATSARNMREASLAKQREAQSVEEVFKIRAEKGLINQQESKAFQETNEMMNRVQRTGREIEKIIEKTRYWKRKGDLTEIEKRRETQNIKNLKSLRGQIEANARTIIANLMYLEKRSDLYSGVVGDVLVALKEIIGPLGLGFLFGGIATKTTGRVMQGMKSRKYDKFIKGMFKK